MVPVKGMVIGYQDLQIVLESGARIYVLKL